MANVLLVDSEMCNQSFQAAFGAGVIIYGHNPYFAACAQQAMSSIDNDDISLVFMNPDLPKMPECPVKDGLGLLVEMASLNLSIPVVLSARTLPVEQLDAIAKESGYQHIVGYERNGRVYDYFKHIPKSPEPTE